MSEREALVDYLRRLGADPARIARASDDHALGALVVEVATGAGLGTPFADAVAQSGLDHDSAEAVWRALGFPAPDGERPLLDADEQAVLSELVPQALALLGPEAALSLARVVGLSTSRVAHAVVDAFRAEVELPGRARGQGYPELVEVYGEVLRTAFPQLQRLLAVAVRRHLVAAAAALWTAEEGQAVPRRDVVIGFVDLAGSRAIAAAASPGRLAGLLSSFEAHVAAAADRHGAHVVKMLGDGAMVVAPDAAVACAFALDVVALVEADPGLPDVRVGMASGPVLLLGGDYHGEIVNLASRLCASALPNSALVTDRVRDSATGFRFTAAEPFALRGFQNAVRAARLLAQ